MHILIMRFLPTILLAILAIVIYLQYRKANKSNEVLKVNIDKLISTDLDIDLLRKIHAELKLSDSELDIIENIILIKQSTNE